MSVTICARAKTCAREHSVIFDLARFHHLWANLSHFLHARTTFDALSIGVVLRFVFSKKMARARRRYACARLARKFFFEFVVEWGIVG